MKIKRSFLIGAGVLTILLAVLLADQNPTTPKAPPLQPPAAAVTETQEQSTTTTAPMTVEPPAAPVIQERFHELLARNGDVVGWLQLPDTKVNYPVAKSVNNDYYLHRDLDRKEIYAGTLFMDYRNAGDAMDRHAIIYGHNMKNGTMFGTLRLYKQKNFYEAHRVFTFSTLYEDIQWEIFSAYVSPATLDLIPTDFGDDAEFMNFITTRQKKSMYPSDIEMKPTDHILTLITCSYEISDARFVIHARKVE